MATRLCPSCRTDLTNNVTPSGECAHCGHDLVVTAPGPGWIVGSIDLFNVARCQRILIFLILLHIVVYAGSLATVQLSPFVALPFAVVNLALIITGIVYVIKLLSALGTGLVTRILACPLMLIPFIGLVVLLLTNSRATTALRMAGLKVGFMGISQEQVRQHLGANRCHQCGYMLLGNTTGQCPECGTYFAPPQAQDAQS